MYIGGINDIDDYDFEFPEQKKLPMALNEKWIHPGYLGPMCYMSDEVFRVMGKKWKKYEPDW